MERRRKELTCGRPVSERDRLIGGGFGAAKPFLAHPGLLEVVSDLSQRQRVAPPLELPRRPGVERPTVRRLDGVVDRLTGEDVPEAEETLLRLAEQARGERFGEPVRRR